MIEQAALDNNLEAVRSILKADGSGELVPRRPKLARVLIQGWTSEICCQGPCTGWTISLPQKTNVFGIELAPTACAGSRATFIKLVCARSTTCGGDIRHSFTLKPSEGCTFTTPYEVNSIEFNVIGFALIIDRKAAHAKFANVTLEQNGQKEADAKMYTVSDVTTTRTEDDALAIAAGNNSVDLMSLLVEHGWSVHRRTPMGQTPLQLAARNACYEATQFLIQHGAPVHADKYEVPLSSTSHPRGDQVAGLLMTHGSLPVHRL